MFLLRRGFVFFILILSSGWSKAQTCESSLIEGRYPPTPRDVVIHEDPYRWLETGSKERLRWIRQQARLFNDSLRGSRSFRFWEKAFYRLYDQPNTIQSTDLSGGRRLDLIDRGLNKPTELVLQGGKWTKTLFSTHELKRNGTAGILKFWVSPNGERVIVPVQYRGSTDVADFHILEVATGRRLEVLKGVQSNWIRWMNSQELAYGVFLKRDEIFLVHRMGRPQSEDTLYDGFWPVTPESKKFVVVFEEGVTWVRGIDGKEWREVALSASRILAERGEFLYLKSTQGETEMVTRLQIRVNRDGESEVIGPPVSFERPKLANLDVLTVADSRLFLEYHYGQRQWVEVRNLAGKKMNEIEVPGCCTVTAIREGGRNQIHMDLESALHRKKEFTYDLELNRFVGADPVKEMMRDTQGREYETHYVKVTSDDGAQVPVRITHIKGLKRDGENAALYQGYGGFGGKGYFYPSYSLPIKVWLEQGGVYVAPALRGGNEFGPEWRRQAQFENKQNTFNDLLAAGRYMIDKGYTRADKQVAMGWSNGGLLMGAMAVQGKDVFGLLVAGNGVHDGLRKDRLDPWHDNGWSYEYGTSDNPAHFQFLKRHFPVQTAQPGVYPKVLIVVGLNDSRVNPAHSFKLAAVLQGAQRGPSPILMMSTKNSGHWLTSEDLQDVIGWRSGVRIWASIFDHVGFAP